MSDWVRTYDYSKVSVFESFLKASQISHRNSLTSYYDCYCSVAQSCLTLCDPMDCSTPGFPVSHQLQSLLKLMFIESVMLSNDLVLCHPLLLPSSFLIIRVFSNESALHIRWPTYWSFNFSISPANEYSGLISFRIDWFDIFGVYGPLESSPAPQFKSINSFVLSLLYGATLIS